MSDSERIIALLESIERLLTRLVDTADSVTTNTVTGYRIKADV